MCKLCEIALKLHPKLHANTANCTFNGAVSIKTALFGAILCQTALFGHAQWFKLHF